MRVRIYPLAGVTGSPVEFTTSAAEDMVDGLEGPLDFESAILPRVDSDEVDVQEYGNVRNAFSFLIERSHDDIVEAALFYLDEPGRCPRIGRVEFLIENEVGTTLATRSLGKAIVKVTRVRWHVCLTVLRYAITGGILH